MKVCHTGTWIVLHFKHECEIKEVWYQTQAKCRTVVPAKSTVSYKWGFQRWGPGSESPCLPHLSLTLSVHLYAYVTRYNVTSVYLGLGLPLASAGAGSGVRT